MNSTKTKQIKTIDSTLNLVFNSCHDIVSKLRPDKVYQAIIDNIWKVIPDVKLCTLFMLSKEDMELRVVQSKGMGTDYLRHPAIKIGHGVTGKVLKTATARIVKDVTDVDECPDYLFRDMAIENNLGGLVSLPLMMLQNAIGVINIYKSKPNKFKTREIHILKILSRQASLAIQNARLYQEVKRQQNDLELVQQITNEIAISTDLDTILDNICRLVSEIVGSDLVFICYQETFTKQWHFKFLDHIDPSKLKFPDLDKLEGIMGHVLKTKTDYYCPDTRQDPYYFEAWKEVRSSFVIPFKVENEIKGLLNVESPYLNAFSEQKRKLISMFASDAGIAISKAQLLQIAEQKNRQMIILREVIEAISLQKSLPEVLYLIAHESLSIVGKGKKVAFVMLVDREKNILETKAVCGDLYRPNHLLFHVPLNERSIVTWAVRNARSKLVNDVDKDPEYFKLNYDTKSELAIPLVFQNEVIGVIDIESSELDAFTEKDKYLLQTLAFYTSIAVKIGELCNIRLKQVSDLYKIGTKVSSSLELEVVLDILARETHRAIGPEHRSVFVHLLTNDGTLEPKAAFGEISRRDIEKSQLTIDPEVEKLTIKNQRHLLHSNINGKLKYSPVDPQAKSFLAVPILFRKKVIGLITAESVHINDFGQHDVELLTSLAYHAAFAIENARLNERLARTQFDLSEAFSTAVVGQTLTELSHDIRNSSSLISSEAQWIEHLIETNQVSSEEIMNAMGKINRWVQLIEESTNSLMMRSQFVQPNFTPIDISTMMKEVGILMSGLCRQYQVEMNIDYPSLDFIAEIDFSRMKLAFINLIKNAIEAMPDGGRLTIYGETENRLAKIYLCDTGSGISEEDKEHIWTPFYSSKKTGSGLGLPSCKRIIETDHNGKIEMESKLNKGTTVIINIPIKQTL